jgi:hypothetical protein
MFKNINIMQYLWNKTLLRANIVESFLHVVPIWWVYLHPYIHAHTFIKYEYYRLFIGYGCSTWKEIRSNAVKQRDIRG